MSTTTPRIILVGYPWDYHSFDEAFQKWIREGLETGEKAIKEAGYDRYSIFFVTPEEGVDPLVQFLQSNEVDGVMIGYGLRSPREATPFFEQLVNAVHVHAPKTKFLFNTNPDSGLEAIQRHFPLSN